MTEKRHWWYGIERRDQEGYRCRIGALWSRIFLRHGWAIVFAQTCWIKNEETWERYQQSLFWRAHEHHHFWQELNYFRGSTIRYLLAFGWQYLRYGYANSSLEREADAAAMKVVEAARD